MVFVPLSCFSPPPLTLRSERVTDTVTAVEREKRELGSSSSVSSKNLTAVPFPFTVPFLLSQSGGGRVVSRGAAAWLLHPSWGRGGRRRLFRLLEKSTGFEGMHKKLRAENCRSQFLH